MDPITTERTPHPSFGWPRVFGRKPLVGDIEILGKRLRRLYELNTQPGETARFCLRGKGGHALVCLDDRLLILKRGRDVGAAFSTLATTVFCRDVTGIQVRLHLVSGWIEIATPSFQGNEQCRPGSRFGTARRDHVAQPNCVPIPRRHVRDYQQALSEVRRLVAAAKSGDDHGGIIGQLERLAALQREGVIDDVEFSRAKARLLEVADPVRSVPDDIGAAAAPWPVGQRSRTVPDAVDASERREMRRAVTG